MAVSPNILYRWIYIKHAIPWLLFLCCSPRNLLPFPWSILLVLQCVLAPKLSTTGFSTLHTTSIQRHPSSNFTSIFPTSSTYQHDLPCTPQEASDITATSTQDLSLHFGFTFLLGHQQVCSFQENLSLQLLVKKLQNRIGPPCSSINGNISNQPLNRKLLPHGRKKSIVVVVLYLDLIGC